MINVCKFCRGSVRPDNSREPPRGFRLYRCDDCDLSNVFPAAEDARLEPEPELEPLR